MYDRGLLLLGAAVPGGHLGLVGLVSTLDDPRSCHTYHRGPRIHHSYGSAEGCQRRQVMEPDARLDTGGQHLRGVKGQALRCQEGQIPMVPTAVGL